MDPSTRTPLDGASLATQIDEMERSGGPSMVTGERVEDRSGSVGDELRRRLATVQMALLVLERGEESSNPLRRKRACEIIARQIRLLAQSVDRLLTDSTS
jgi:hypothetical protein